MKILILCMSIFLAACSSSKNNKVSLEETTTVTLKNIVMSSDNKDCYSDRKTTSKVNMQAVEVKEIVGTFMFVYNNKRLQPCDLAKEYCRDGVKLIVSGEVREIFPTERRAGTPFYCTEMKIEMQREH